MTCPSCAGTSINGVVLDKRVQNHILLISYICVCVLKTEIDTPLISQNQNVISPLLDIQ